MPDKHSKFLPQKDEHIIYQQSIIIPLDLSEKQVGVVYHILENKIN